MPEVTEPPPDAATPEPDPEPGITCEDTARPCGDVCLELNEACDDTCEPGYEYCSGICVADDTPAGLCGNACASLWGPQLAMIPAGTGVIGSTDLPNTDPVLNPTFQAFCIDTTEVTTAQYRECVDAGACQPPDVGIWDSCTWQDTDREDHPVTCVTHAHAAVYCAWAGKRLPSEKEWEYAARGTAGRLYPWGNEAPSSALLNFRNNLGTTAAVGSFPAGATPEGVYDLAGNVWEWTGSEWCDNYASTAACQSGNYVARGGSLGSSYDEFVRSSWRDPDSAGDSRFGFRCALGDGLVE